METVTDPKTPGVHIHGAIHYTLYKANVGEEASSEDWDDDAIAFINIDCAALIKDGPGSTVIIDTGASSHMITHKNLLRDYQSFPKPRTIFFLGCQ